MPTASEVKARIEARIPGATADLESPDNVHFSARVVADAFAGLSRIEQAVELRPHDFAVLYNAACNFAGAGQRDKALDLLDQATGAMQAQAKAFRDLAEGVVERLDSLSALKLPTIG